MAPDASSEHYEFPIERLGLSDRALNCLKRADVNTIGEVLEMTKAELLRIRNFGEKSYYETYEKMKAKSLLPEGVEPEGYD